MLEFLIYLVSCLWELVLVVGLVFIVAILVYAVKVAIDIMRGKK